MYIFEKAKIEDEKKDEVKEDKVIFNCYEKWNNGVGNLNKNENRIKNGVKGINSCPCRRDCLFEHQKESERLGAVMRIRIQIQRYKIKGKVEFNQGTGGFFVVNLILNFSSLNLKRWFDINLVILLSQIEIRIIYHWLLPIS